MKNLYIFIDESGNFDFSPSGTKHLVLCSYSTTEPQQHTLALQELKYRFLAEGVEAECFHATEDKQHIRDEVYEIIKDSKNAIYDLVYIEKNKTHPAKQSKKEVYSLMVGTLLTYIFVRLDKQTYKYDQIIVIIDQALSRTRMRK